MTTILLFITLALSLGIGGGVIGKYLGILLDLPILFTTSCIYLFTVSTAYIIIKRFSQSYTCNLIQRWCCILLLLFYSSISGAFIPREAFLLYLISGTLLTYALITLKGTLEQKIFWTSLETMVALLCHSLLFNMKTFILNRATPTPLMLEDLNMFIGIAMIQLVLFYFLRLILLYGTDLNNLIKLWKKSMLLLFVPFICVGIIVLMIVLTISLPFDLFNKLKGYTLLGILGIICSNLFTIVFYTRAEKFHQKQLLLNHFREKYITQQELLMQSKKSYLELKKMKHDIKNHLHLIHSMLDDQNLESARAYLKTYLHEMDSLTHYKVLCEHHSINYIVSLKENRCINHQIQLYTFIDQNISPIGDVDLCILLGNLLDNAIDHNSCVGQKEISLTLQQINNFLRIQVKNTISASVLTTNPNLLTSKPQAAEHGIGLSSVQQIVDKYHGMLDFEEDTHFFYCNILLDTELPDTK